jgi:hypothetical protein
LGPIPNPQSPIPKVCLFAKVILFIIKLSKTNKLLIIKFSNNINYIILLNFIKQMLTPQQQKARDMKFVFAFTYDLPTFLTNSIGIWTMVASLITFLMNLALVIFFFVDHQYFKHHIYLINLANMIYQTILWFFIIISAFTKRFGVCHPGALLINFSVVLESLLLVIYFIILSSHTFYRTNEINGMLYFATICLTLIYYIIFVISGLLFYLFTKDLGLKSEGVPVLLVQPYIANNAQSVQIQVQPIQVQPSDTYIPPHIKLNDPNYCGQFNQELNSAIVNQQVHITVAEPDANQCPSLNASYVYGSKITLIHPEDLLFAENFQNSVVNEVTLPSGIRVPTGVEGKAWRIVRNEIIFI